MPNDTLSTHVLQRNSWKKLRRKSCLEKASIVKTSPLIGLKSKQTKIKFEFLVCNELLFQDKINHFIINRYEFHVDLLSINPSFKSFKNQSLIFDFSVY